MTSITTNEDLASPVDQTQLPARISFLEKFAQWAERLADRANPILVKETRQALKSRQFVLTFLVVLIGCWVASFATIAIIGPSVFYGAEGPRMLIIYCMLLAFPLFVIVPYSAFRSLSVEQEENTYELLTITTLSSSQIVTGKLLNVILQMIVYLSAVSPCIAFTFLLRGVDALSVAVLIGYIVLVSLGLSMIALFVGTLAQVRYMQTLLSVLLVLCMGIIYFNTFDLIEEYLRNSIYMVRDQDFWIGTLLILTFFSTTFALLHAAAAARIAFPSENRSTRLRVWMVIQQACVMGWMSSLIKARGLPNSLVVTGIVTGIYWYFMGILMTSEWPHFSRRVQRSLPQSYLGKVFFTWFNPGPGTGYFFCVANLTMIAATGVFLVSMAPNSSRYAEVVNAFLLLGSCYVALFLGVGKLLISLLRRFVYVSMTSGVLLHIILLLAACGLPQIIAYMSSSSRFSTDYSLLHVSNPIWTLLELIDNGPNAFDIITTFVVLGCATTIVLLLNIRLLGAELHYQRRQLPTRVAEEEAALHPVPEPKTTSPWDEQEQVEVVPPE